MEAKPPLHPPRICTAIRAHHVVCRYRKRESCSAFLAGDGLAVYVYREAARFAYHLLRAGERFDVRATTAAVTSFAFMRPHFIIFGVQAIELQELFPVRGGEVREPGLAEG